MPTRPTPTRSLRAAVVCCLLLVGCGADGGGQGEVEVPDAVVADGWSLEVVRDDLRRPTQVTRGPEGTLYAAQLAGGEGAGEGQVVRLVPGEEPEVLLDGLQKPTGLAVTEDAIWVQVEQVILRAPFDGESAGTPEEVQATSLPNNGRSQGTLTVLPDGRMAHEASGTGSGPEPAEGSGVLYALDPADGVEAQPIAIATGFKGAYAHAPSGDGQLWVVEVGDGTYDGEPPPGELNVLDPAAPEPPDGGWPQCIGDQQPVEENGGGRALCAGTLEPTTLFEPGATPTSVVETDGGRVLVALWVEDRVVEVTDDGEVTDVLTGVERPQHLLATDDGVLLTVFGTDELWRLTPS